MAKFKRYSVGGLPVGEIKRNAQLFHAPQAVWRVQIFEGAEGNPQWVWYSYTEDGLFIGMEHAPNYERHLIHRNKKYDRALAGRAARILRDAGEAALQPFVPPAPPEPAPQAAAWQALVDMIRPAPAPGVWGDRGEVLVADDVVPAPADPNRQLKVFLVIQLRPGFAPAIVGQHKNEGDAKRTARVNRYPCEILYLEENF